MQFVIHSELAWSRHSHKNAKHDMLRGRGGGGGRQLWDHRWKIWAVIRNNNTCWKVVQTTLAANLHCLLWGLAGPLANLFFCLCLGETITSNFVPEFDDLTCPRLAENMVTCKTMSGVWAEVRKQRASLMGFCRRTPIPGKDGKRKRKKKRQNEKICKLLLTLY